MEIVHGKAIDDRIKEIVHVFVLVEVRLEFLLQLIAPLNIFLQQAVTF